MNGSDVPFLGSLLVDEERMRSSGCLQYWLASGRTSGLRNYTSFPSWNVLSLHSSSFTDVVSAV